MELFAYLGLALLTIFFCFKSDFIASPRMFFIFWFAVYTSLILVVRSTFDTDIKTYAASMSMSTLSSYFLKEPVVWLGQRYLFLWLQNSLFVFVIFDILAGLLLFRALKEFNLPQYAFFSILIFFPSILGMQNAYRQWIATILFLYCFSLVWTYAAGMKKYIFFTLSVLSHNVAAIFIPLLFIRNRKVLGHLIWYGAFLIAFFGILFGANTKSSAETGADLTLVYLFFITFLIMLVPLLDRGVIRKSRNLEYKLLTSLFFLSSFSMLILASAGAERVSMFCLLIAYPILVLLVEDSFKQRVLVRALFSLLGFIPMFFFSVSKFIVGT